MIPAIEALAARFDIPLSVDTWRASVAREAYRAGAVVGNDISGFADPDYLPAAAEYGATVVATHIRLGPRIPDPDPVYDDVVESVAPSCSSGPTGRVAAGIAPDRIVIDAGLDLGKTAAQSLTLLRASDRLADLGLPAAAVGVQQDLPRRGPGPRDRGAPGGVVGRHLARGGPRVPGDAGPRGRRPPPGVRRAGRHRPGTQAADERLGRRPPPGCRPPTWSRAPTLAGGPGHPPSGRAAGGRRRPVDHGRGVRGPGVDQFDVGAVIDACTTPPFLVDRRVVVVREAGPDRGRRRQAPGRLPGRPAAHHRAGAGGRRRCRQPDPVQGGGRRRRGGRHLGRAPAGPGRSGWPTT